MVLSNHTHRILIGFSLLTLSVYASGSVLSIFNIAPEITFGALGKFVATVMPILFLCFAVLFYKYQSKNVLKPFHLIGSLLFFAIFSTLVHLSSSLNLGSGAIAIRNGGGWIGYFIATMFSSLTGSFATVVVFILLILNLILLLPEGFNSIISTSSKTRFKIVKKNVFSLIGLGFTIILLINLVPENFYVTKSTPQTKDVAQNTDTSTASTKEMVPKLQFKQNVEKWTSNKLNFLRKNAISNEDISLQYFVYDHKVSTDDKFEIATVNLYAEISSEDVIDGASVGVFAPNLNNLQPKIFCAGQNYLGTSVFLNYVQHFFHDLNLRIDNLQDIQLPSSGIVFRLNWRQVRVVVDKFGSEENIYKEIGEDEVSISSKNVKMVTNSLKADFLKLSDMKPPKIARTSWYSGICESAQRLNN